MAPADVRRLELNVVLLRPPDRQSLLEQRKSEFLVVDLADQNPAHSIPVEDRLRLQTVRHSLIQFFDSSFQLPDRLVLFGLARNLLQQVCDRFILRGEFEFVVLIDLL